MLYHPDAATGYSGNLLTPLMSFGKRPGFGFLGFTTGVSEYADADITVANGIATTTVTATDYTWPVAVGGAGAPDGQIGYLAGFALITVDSVNYRWPVMPTGAGSVAIDVTNGIATITIGSDDIEWAVEEV